MRDLQEHFYLGHKFIRDESCCNCLKIDNVKIIQTSFFESTLDIKCGETRNLFHIIFTEFLLKRHLHR